MTGTECQTADADVRLEETSGTTPVVADRKDNVVVAANGFSTTLTVPAGARVTAEYTVVAFCGLESDPASAYEPVEFFVTPKPAPSGATLTVTPTTGDPGTVVTVSGTGCTAATADVIMGVSYGESGDLVAESQDVVVTGGSFTTTLTLPADADADGESAIFAFCGQSDDPDFVYERQVFDVTGNGRQTGQSGYRMVAADGGVFTFGTVGSSPSGPPTSRARPGP